MITLLTKTNNTNIIKLAENDAWHTHTRTRMRSHFSLNYLNCVPVDHRLKIHDGVEFHRTRQQPLLFLQLDKEDPLNMSMKKQKGKKEKKFKRQKVALVMVQCKPLLLLFLVFFSHHPLFCWYFNINIYEKGCVVAQIKRDKCRQKKSKHETQATREF